MPVIALTISAGGKQLASAGLDGTVCVWDVATGQASAVLKGHTDRVIWVAFSPHDNVLATSGNDQVIKIRRIPE
jgi:WD40 repeat protein